MTSTPAGVLVLTLNSSMGGTERSILSLYDRMDKNAFRVCIATLIGDGTLIRLARARGLDAVSLNMHGPLDVGVVLRLQELIRSRRISILHTYIYHTGILGRLLGWACTIPIVVCSQRSTDDWRSVFHVLLDRWTQNFVTCFLANCQAVARRLHAVERIAEEKIRVIRTGIEPMRHAQPDRVACLRKALAIAEDAPVVGTVANFRAAKGHLILIEAAKKVLARHAGAVFVWVGDGPLRKELEEAIAGQGLQKNFRLADFQSNTAPYYVLCDVFVLPSFWEGVPLALLEAMSLGLPIVATKVGGVPEILCDGEDARLVAPRDPEALAAAIAEVLAAPNAAAVLGRNAKVRFEKENSLARYVGQTEDLYKQFLDNIQGT